eukprot:SAG31_NODE_649_length_13201_cov_12.359258_8_plen_114_part_00
MLNQLRRTYLTVPLLTLFSSHAPSLISMLVLADGFASVILARLLCRATEPLGLEFGTEHYFAVFDGHGGVGQAWQSSNLVRSSFFSHPPVLLIYSLGDMQAKRLQTMPLIDCI